MLVDARGLLFSGIGRYLREVLVRLGRDERFRQVTLLGSRPDLLDFVNRYSPPPGRFTVVDFRYPMYSLAAQAAWLRLRAMTSLADVHFFPHYDAPALAMPPRSVVTIHDLIHFKVPEGFPRIKRLLGGLLLKRAFGGAERVLTDSVATSGDLTERFPDMAHKVRVVPLGVDPFFQPGGAEGRTLDRPRIVPDAPYLLCVGNRKSHKNLTAAVEVLALLRDARPDLRLVVVGKEFDGWEGPARLAEGLGLLDRVVEHVRVSDSELRDLYRHCEALLFPSYYEGFGLPVLEAMACGTPVIASNRSSIPEVAGEAATLLDPDDHRGMAEAIQRLAENPSLRREQIRRGIERASRFTWESTATQTADQLAAVGRSVLR